METIWGPINDSILKETVAMLKELEAPFVAFRNERDKPFTKPASQIVHERFLWGRQSKYDLLFNYQKLLNAPDPCLFEQKPAWYLDCLKVTHFGKYEFLQYDDEQNFELNHPMSTFDFLTSDENFQKQVVEIRKEVVDILERSCGRESPPYKSGIGDWLRRDLRKEFRLLTGCHYITNAVVQTLLAKHMGKNGIVVSTGDGKYGLAIAVICFLVGLQCIIRMSAQDMEDQRISVSMMRICWNAEVRAVHSGIVSKSAAICVWMTNLEATLGYNAMGNGAMSYLKPDDDNVPQPYSISARPDSFRSRRSGSYVSRQDQEYYNQLCHQSVRFKWVLGAVAFTSNFATLTRNGGGLARHCSELCIWFLSIFEELELDSLFTMLERLRWLGYTTGLQQIWARWRNVIENLASDCEVVSRVMHFLSGMADEAARVANRAEMAIIPARDAAVRAAAARRDTARTAAAPADIADDS